MGREFRSPFVVGFDPGFDSGALGWSVLGSITGILLYLLWHWFGELMAPINIGKNAIIVLQKHPTLLQRQL